MTGTIIDWQAKRADDAVLIRKMMLDLIEISTFNAFNGKKVREDLESVPDAWESCMMTRDGDCGITLRDLSSGCFNVDTLYILTNRKNYLKVLRLAEKWQADHILQYRSDGQFGANRWESSNGEAYEYSRLKNEKQTASDFMSGGGPDRDKKVIIRLWWD